MNILKEDIKLCYGCMEEHSVKYVRVQESITFKDKPIKYYAEYEYCDKRDDYLENEEQMERNRQSLQEAYNSGGVDENY